METQLTGQRKAQASREFPKKLLMLAAAGGTAFWIIDFVISVSPIAAEYKAAFSISSLPVALVEALAGGVVIALCVSLFLLRFFDRIPGKKSIFKALILSFFYHGHYRSLFSAWKPGSCLRLPPARHRNECSKIYCPWIGYWLFIR